MLTKTEKQEIIDNQIKMLVTWNEEHIKECKCIEEIRRNMETIHRLAIG